MFPARLCTRHTKDVGDCKLMVKPRGGHGRACDGKVGAGLHRNVSVVRPGL